MASRETATSSQAPRLARLGALAAMLLLCGCASSGIMDKQAAAPEAPKPAANAEVDPAAIPKMRAIRDRYVNVEKPPASTLVVVSRLARPGWLIEIEAVAAIEG